MHSTSAFLISTALPGPSAARLLRTVCASLLFTLALAGQTSLTVTTTSLPNAPLGRNYSQALQVSGGTPPYKWAEGANGQGFPTGLTLNSAGVISGTPTVPGTYTFFVTVTDANNKVASANFNLTVAASSLQITTTSLFNGTAGAAYAFTFAAQGGTPPYNWTAPSGSPDGLSLNPAGVLSGTPQTAGTWSFAVQVTDSAGGVSSQSFSILVNNPSLVLTPGSFPAGAVGVPYTQNSPAAVASGGTPPYTWSIAAGSVPGLTFVPAGVSLTGTPTTPGTFTLQLQVSDSSGLTASKSLTVTIAGASLSITTFRQLPNATLNAPYSQQLAATGGAPPYIWGANGLPKGLSINSTTGLITGVPTAAGAFPIVVITVLDSALNSSQDNFSLTVNLPSVPAVTISGLPATADPASQFPLQVTLAAPYAAPMTGQLIIGFQSSTGLGDSTIQFSTGGKTANFNVPAGSTSAIFTDANGIPVSQLQIQNGTVAGSVSVSLSGLNAAGVDITPVPAPAVTTQIAAAAPVISSVSVTSDGNGGCPKGEICLQVTGFSTAREVDQATFTFSAVAGQTLQASAASVTVDVSSLFNTWFATSTIGSQFIFNQPFTVQGSPAAVIPMAVTLTNRTGTATSNISH